MGKIFSFKCIHDKFLFNHGGSVYGFKDFLKWFGTTNGAWLLSWLGLQFIACTLILMSFTEVGKGTAEQYSILILILGLHAVTNKLLRKCTELDLHFQSYLYELSGVALSRASFTKQSLNIFCIMTVLAVYSGATKGILYVAVLSLVCYTLGYLKCLPVLWKIDIMEYENLKYFGSIYTCRSAMSLGTGMGVYAMQSTRFNSYKPGDTQFPEQEQDEDTEAEDTDGDLWDK